MKALTLVFLCLISPLASAKAIINADVFGAIRFSKQANGTPLELIVFLNPDANKQLVIEELRAIEGVKVNDLNFIPALAIQSPKDANGLNQIAEIQGVAHITRYQPARAELDISAQILKLSPSYAYPDVSNWWANGYTGKKGIIGLIDTGIDFLHPALAKKNIIIRQEEGSGFSEYYNGVKEPHGTGVACIYASNDSKYKGIAFDAPTILSGLSGDENAQTASIMQTMSSLDWMLNRAPKKPTLINYSMGNGRMACTDCPEWSGLAKVMDYVINSKKILWVKSAGNLGYIEPSTTPLFASTLTVPGDNYNGLTIANMDTTVNAEQGVSLKVVQREQHQIRYTSSRGPTPWGRKKPDLTAPGHDTRTCAPDPALYHFDYSPSMDYHNGYRLMGGTSSAAPHVGGAALLLQDAGINDPMAIKALLINSADSWTDEGTEKTNHHEIMGSLWNRTYGWGYINMEKAFTQRNNIHRAALSLAHPSWEYKTTLQVGDKITLVHERRVGYTKEGREWALSPVSLEIIDLHTNQVIDSDDSPIDTVHQISNCKRHGYQRDCSADTHALEVLVRVKLLGSAIDGSPEEPFVLVTNGPSLSQIKQ